jgi:hypothetical protein
VSRGSRHTCGPSVMLPRLQRQNRQKAASVMQVARLTVQIHRYFLKSTSLASFRGEVLRAELGSEQLVSGILGTLSLRIPDLYSCSQTLRQQE